jgi:hypothetical protein
MMTLLSLAFTQLAGPLFRTVALPMLIMALLVTSHQLVKARDAGLVRKGEKICDARWEEQVRQQERTAAEGRIRIAQQYLDTERETTNDLRLQIGQAQEDLEAMRKAGGGGDSRCLSDGMLDALRRREGGGASAKPPANKRAPAPGGAKPSS